MGVKIKKYLSHSYGKSFYECRRSKTLPAAREILRLINCHFQIGSVIDVGCGTGTWLWMSRELGAKVVQGIEGNWLRDEYLDSNDIDIVRHDLETRIPSCGRYDLAISLEVAEHLSATRSKSFINDLCSVSDIILFSAAIPGQGGPGHVNEQWQSYWAKLFRHNKYLAFDLVRPIIWDNPSIPFWYRQNTLVYIAQSRYKNVKKNMNLQPTENIAFLNLVHPENYEEKISPGVISRIKTLFGSLPAMLQWFYRSLAKIKTRQSCI